MTPHYFYWRFLFWPQLAGAIFLVLGFFAIRKQLPIRFDALPIFGRVFVPFALATFGAEHMASAGFMKDMVPSFIPGHVFWIYFVGCGLFAAALSIIFRKRVELSASLLGFMFLTFVLTMHLPGAIEARNNRVIWTVVARDFFFALGAWTLAATTIRGRTPQARGSSFADSVIFACRILGGLILVFFGVEHLLHPAVIPGVPLEALTPAWMPLKHTWGFVIGVLSLASGATMLVSRSPVNRYAKCAAIALAIGVTIVVVGMNVPMLIKAVEPSEINLAMNYIGDSLLFAGMVFFFAEAMP